MNDTSTITQLPEVAVFADGSSLGNPGPGGYATVLVCRGKRKEICEGFDRTTGNRMELMAVIAGLEALKSPCRVVVFSDSTYVINGINKGWAKRWKENGWKRRDDGPVANVDLWERVLRMCDKHEVRAQWKPRNGTPELRRCDELACEVAASAGLPQDPGYAKKAA